VLDKEVLTKAICQVAMRKEDCTKTGKTLEEFGYIEIEWIILLWNTMTLSIIDSEEVAS
jgi:hypothetical protein